MKCPRCGLVHAPHTQVCRRCEINLQTGEPMPRASSPLEAADKRSGIKTPERGKTGKSKQEKTPQPEKPEERQPPDEPAERRHSGPERESTEKKSKRDLARYFPGGTGSQARVSCIQCTAFMQVRKDYPYRSSYPLVFMVLGLVLAVAGIFIHLLLLPALAAVLAGMAYVGYGGSYWLCPQCGYRIDRQDKPVREMFITGMNRKKSSRHPAIHALAIGFNILLVMLVIAAVITAVFGVVSIGADLFYLLVGMLVFWMIARVGMEIIVRAAIGGKA